MLQQIISINKIPADHIPLPSPPAYVKIISESSFGGVIMGTTAFTLHVYSNEPVDPALGHFFSLSEGWQSMLLDSEHPDMDQCAGKLSKKVSAPILVFCIYDSEEVSFGIYENGKRCAVFSSSICHTSKGIFKIPGLVGYPYGYKRRISEILSCPLSS